MKAENLKEQERFSNAVTLFGGTPGFHNGTLRVPISFVTI